VKKNFSVLISVYEKEQPFFFEACLAGIEWQTLQPEEVIVVADGVLTPHLYQVIENYASSLPVKLVQLPTNVGLGQALNIGLAHAKFEIIARVDSDDICYPERFQVQYKFLKENSKVSAVSSYLSEFKTVVGDLQRKKIVPIGHEVIRAYAKKRNPLNHPAVMFKKADVIEVGSYKHMPFFEDYYLWLRMIEHGFLLENIPQPLVHFRVGNDMIGRRHGISYVRHEFHFLKTAVKENLIAKPTFLALIFLRLPVRLIPKAWLNLIYQRVLR